MKIVGLYIGQGRVAATVVQRQFGKTDLQGSFSAPCASDAELIALLREKAKEWAGARIVSALPGHLFTQRTLAFPFAERKKIEKALPYEIEDAVPFSLDEMVVDHLPLDGEGKTKGTETAVLGLVLPKAVLRQHLDLLREAGIDPPAVVPSYAGLAAVERMMPAEGCTLIVNGRDLCLRSGGSVKAIRSLGASATGGLPHALQALETESAERVEKALLLSSDAEAGALLAGSGIAVEHVAPELGGRKADDPGSLGIALAGEVNFRKGEFAYRVGDEGARRKRRTVAIAAAAALVLFGANIGVKLSIVRAGYGALDREMKEIFHQTFPDSRLSGDPLRQMRDKYTEAQKRIGVLGSGASVLDVMKTVTDGIPKEIRVAFQEFTLEGERVRLQGDAPSFEAVDKVKAELQKSPLFAEVTLQDTRMGVENKVKFRMELKLKQGK